MGQQFVYGEMRKGRPKNKKSHRALVAFTNALVFCALVEPRGFEPLTFALPVRRSPS